MKSWRLFPTISAPMPFQMALDELLFRRYEESENRPAPLLRFYLSSGPWITVGYSQPAEAGPVPSCKRITGGGRVVHGNDVIFSLVASKESDASFKSVSAAYHKIHQAVQAGLSDLKLKTRFYRDDENLSRGGDCFLYPIATDLALGENKIAGGAQKRSSGVLLHQESVQLPKTVNWSRMIAAIKDGFGKIFEISLRDEALNPALLKEAGKRAL